MNRSQIKDAIDNEFKRVKIQNHPEYSEWFDSLRSYAKLIVESILQEDLSPEVISLAQESPSDELEEYEFLGVIAAMELAHSDMLSLTNTALESMLSDLSKV